MAGGTIARTAHFALHRLDLNAASSGSETASLTGPGASPSSEAAPQALFALPGAWLGAMVPKRWARRAVTRNTIKRQIYAVAAEHALQLPAHAHVVRLRSTFDRKQFISPTSDVLKKAVRAELLQLFARAQKNTRDALPGRDGAATGHSV